MRGKVCGTLVEIYSCDNGVEILELVEFSLD